MKLALIVHVSPGVQDIYTIAHVTSEQPHVTSG